MEQARDFLAECEAVGRLLEGVSDADYARETQFKNWTINQIMQHLLFFDRLAGLSITDPEKFDRAYGDLNELRERGMSLTEATDYALDGLDGIALLRAWEHGAKSWSKSKREQFANDPINLVAVEASLNREKGAKGLDEWLPPKNQGQYKVRFERVLTKYGLQ